MTVRTLEKKDLRARSRALEAALTDLRVDDVLLIRCGLFDNWRVVLASGGGIWLEGQGSVTIMPDDEYAAATIRSTVRSGHPGR